MPLKFAKTGIKVSQKIPSGRAKKATSVKVSKSSGNKQSDDERLDMGTSPTDELAEAVMNEYGLTTRRPVLVGLFDFNPLFNHQLGPTAASRMFDLQIAATDLTMSQAKRMHRIFQRSGPRRKTVYKKQMARRFQQKMAEAVDLTNTLDNVHGLIRLIVDELDIKRNKKDIHGRLKVNITSGLANSRTKSNPDIWGTIGEKGSFRVTSLFESHGISQTFWKAMNNTTWLLQIAHEIRFLLLYGSPSWYSFDETERTDKFFEYYEDIDDIEGDDSELSGNEIVPIGGETHPAMLFKSMNPFKSQLWPSNPNDASWNAIRKRLESFKDVIDGQDPGSEDYIGTLLGMLAKDLRAYRALKDGDLDDALRMYGVSKKLLIREESIDDSQKFIKNIMGRFQYGADATRIVRSKKQHKNSLIKAFYASKKNKHGMATVDGFGLPFERIPVGGDVDNDTCRELFVNKAFKEGSFGDFSDFSEYVESFNETIRDALGAAAAWDGWEAANDGFATPHIRFDGAEAVFSMLDSISDYVSESGFNESEDFKFNDSNRKEGVRLAIIQGANYSDSVKKELLQHFIFREYTMRTMVGSFSGDMLNSAEVGEGTVFGSGYGEAEDLTGNKYGARMELDSDKHIGGTTYISKKIFKASAEQIKNANKDYYNSIVSLNNAATTYFKGRGSKDPFNTTSMTGEKIAGISPKDKGFTFGIVNKQYILENKRQDSGDNVMVSQSGMKTNPIAVALFPQGEQASTIFDLPGVIVENWIKASGGGAVISADNITSFTDWGVLPPSKATLKNYLNDTTPILDMNYWGLYAMACELLIEIVGEYFNFKVSFDDAYYERWALFKNDKKKEKKKSKVQSLAASGEYSKIASVNYVDVAVQRSTVFAFRWYPDQMRGAYNGWKVNATRSQKNNKVGIGKSGDGDAKELTEHYHSVAGAIVQYAEYGDNNLKWAMEWFLALGNHMRGINNEVKKVIGRKGAVGGLKNFFEDLNENPEYGNLIRSLNEMQTHNRRHAISRMGVPSSKYGFISSSEKVSSHKIRQILAMMTDPEFRQDGHDNGLENRRIMAIGLPSGTLDTLREIAYVESGEDDEAYQESSFIRLDVYKRDIRDDTRRFEPISFIFDMRMFTTDDETKFNLDFDNLISAGSGDNAVVFSAGQLDTVEPEEAVPFFDEVLNTGVKFVQYKTFYDSKNGKTRTTPFKGSKPVESAKFSIARTFQKGVREDIVRNHAINDLVKAYLKCMSGIDLYEETFMIGATDDDFSGIDSFTGSRALSSEKQTVGRRGRKRRFKVAKDEEIEPMFENFLRYWKVAKRAERHPDHASTKSLYKAVDTMSRSRRFHAAKIKNRIVQPKIFERVFCIVFDPLTDFDEIEPDHESNTSALSAKRAAKRSGMSKFLLESSRGLESPAGMREIRRSIRKGDFSVLENFQANCFDFYVTISLLPSY